MCTLFGGILGHHKNWPYEHFFFHFHFVLNLPKEIPFRERVLMIKVHQYVFHGTGPTLLYHDEEYSVFHREVNSMLRIRNPLRPICVRSVCHPCKFAKCHLGVVLQ